MHPLSLLTPLLFLILPAAAQFQFFEQMFGGGGGGPQQPPQNAASDSSWYQAQYENAVEDKVELGDGSMICASKGGWSQGEAGRKIELARKGLL
ncbi:hypothetical protein D0861_05058 [Hortaea werneckii]|uniref:Long chronological lifespan protein 2 n=1 Tax=Hortaea werneckii TaxID=91943 RepID=A0A3M7FGZ2_HORWE|nr:hypothetical protein D0861_05058 [Hortaea werneckii]